MNTLRKYELENIQARIEDATNLNYTKSDWLNNCILAACATPLVAFIARVFSARYSDVLALAGG